MADLQARLRELAFDAEGAFVPVTELAVRRFQEAQGLLSDGIVGPLTRAAPGGGGAGGADRAGRAARGERRGAPSGARSTGGRRVSRKGPRPPTWWSATAPSSRSSIRGSGRSTLGLAGTGGRVDRRSIGIEIASEGWLGRRGTGWRRRLGWRWGEERSRQPGGKPRAVASARSTSRIIAAGRVAAGPSSWSFNTV